MTPLENREIFEMLNAFLDGRLSQRQETELRRLMQNDARIGEELDKLRRQRELLSSLPIETAPENLLGDIRASIERKVLLNEIQPRSPERRGTRHLAMRQLTTVAAMLVLVGAMAMVVYHILTPADDQRPRVTALPAPSQNVGPMQEFNERKSGLDQMVLEQDQAKPLYVCSLRLETAEPIAVNAYVEKAIQANGLVGCTVPFRLPDRNLNSYTITCEAKDVAGLVRDLSLVWHKFSAGELTVHGTAPMEALVIDNVNPRYVAGMFEAYTGHEDPLEFAEAYQQRYVLLGQVPGQGMAAVLDEMIDPKSKLVPVKPVLTAPPAAPDKRFDRIRAKQPVKLIISLVGL